MRGGCRACIDQLQIGNRPLRHFLDHSNAWSENAMWRKHLSNRSFTILRRQFSNFRNNYICIGKVFIRARVLIYDFLLLSSCNARTSGWSRRRCKLSTELQGTKSSLSLILQSQSGHALVLAIVGAKWLTLKLALILCRRLAGDGAADEKICYISVGVDCRSS